MDLQAVPDFATRVPWPTLGGSLDGDPFPRKPRDILRPSAPHVKPLDDRPPL